MAVYAFHLLGELAPAFGEFKKGSPCGLICRPLCGLQAFERFCSEALGPRLHPSSVLRDRVAEITDGGVIRFVKMLQLKDAGETGSPASSQMGLW